MTIEASGRRLEVDWVESGGPAMRKPTHKGFGTRLLDIVAAGPNPGEGENGLSPEGLHLTLSVPLPAEA